MAVVLPLVTFALIVATLPRAGGMRARLLSAAVVWGVLVTLVTEGASAFGVLRPRTLTVAWAAIALGAALTVARRGPPEAVTRRADRLGASNDALVLLLPVAAVILGTGLLAAVAWPSQWDSMVYHLPRIDHWLQNRSVAFYPTNVVRQLFNPPWSEYAALHLIAIGGDERCGNAVAWGSMLGSLVGVSLIAAHLGAGARGQIFAVLACATLRMGILQAAGTQNDYVIAFWLVCMTEALLATAPAVVSPWGALRVGAALGLAMLTKGTAVLFAVPLLLALWPWNAAWTRMLRSALPVALVVAALNGPHWARNLATFGSPLGPESSGSATGTVDDSLVNAAMTPGLFVSNVVRNLTIHAGTGWGALDATVTRLVERGHAAVGLDASDPRTSRLYPEARFAIVGSLADPDRTGNPVHLLLMLGAAGSILATAGLRRRPRVTRYLLGLALAFAAFCLVLKYQPWHSRLHLPWFVLAAPLVGVAAEAWSASWSIVAAIAMSLLAVPPLVKNNLGPLVLRSTVFNVPRDRQYFHWFGQPTNPFYSEVAAAADTLRRARCADVGLMIGWDDWEHPWWVLVSDEGRDPIRVRHVGVENASARLAAAEPAFVPCGIVVGRRPVGERLDVEGASYRLAWAGADWKVFITDASSAAATVR